MSNYFKTVNTKSVTQSRENFNSEDCRFDLLLNYYKNQARPIESDLKNVDNMFKRWCDLLFNNYNIAVQGRQSKYRLLETFKARYLDSGRIPNFRVPSAKNGSSTLNVTTVRLHGFTQITLERFCHGLFGIINEHIGVNDLRDQFLNDAKKRQIHYVFLLHSFDSLYRNCKPICDLIFQLYKYEPEYIHILLSADHIYSGKILNKFKFNLQLVFYHVSYGASFFHERTHNFAGIEQDNDNNDIIDNIFAGQLNLSSLKDVYQALQTSCKAILRYILNNFVEASKMIEAETILEQDRRTSRRLITHKATLNKDLEFDRLLNHCQSQFILQRPNVLRNHLDELKDHEIIAIDDKTKWISCLVSVGVCQKFLNWICTSTD